MIALGFSNEDVSWWHLTISSQLELLTQRTYTSKILMTSDWSIWYNHK